MELPAALMMHMLLAWAGLVVAGLTLFGLWSGLKAVLRYFLPPTGSIPKRYWVVPRSSAPADSPQSPAPTQPA